MHDTLDPPLKSRLAAWLLTLGLASSPFMPAVASQQLASDMGCYNCHGSPPKKKAPTFAQLAATHAKARDDAKALQKLADKLRDGSIFSHIDAHERLTPEAALQLVRWISEGAQ
jgi:cytochrome c